jgi:acid phosphatase family membrane protein YuiD
MSQPVARIAFFAVIGLVLVVAAYLAVQGVFAKAESAGVQAHTVSGLQTNLNHDRSTASEVELQKLAGHDSLYRSGYGNGHSCDSEARMSPED